MEINKLALGQDLTISYLGRLTLKRDLIRSYDLNFSMKAKKMELAGWPRFKVKIEKGDVQQLFCNSQSSNAVGGGLHYWCTQKLCIILALILAI